MQNPYPPTLPTVEKITYYGFYPVKTKCENCHSEVVTKPEYKVGQYTW
jgi:hypothetical protein